MLDIISFIRVNTRNLEASAVQCPITRPRDASSVRNATNFGHIGQIN